jgi:hypothetical protein
VELVGVVEVVGGAHGHDQVDERVGRGIALPRSGEPQHGHERDQPRAAAKEERRGRRVPHEESADGAAHLELVAHLEHVVEERRDLAVVEPLHGELELVAAVGR